MNKIINFGVDEDGMCGVEVVEDVSGWEWLGYMVSGGLNSNSSGFDMYDNWKEVLEEVLNENVSGRSDDEEMDDISESWKEFIDVLEKEIDGNKMVLGYSWSVEYDWNIGVMICG